MKANEIMAIANDYFFSVKKINPNGSVDVEGDLDMSHLDKPRLPLDFRYVFGKFSCFLSQLETLEGAPEGVTGNCDLSRSRSLFSLVGGPETVGGSYSCDVTAITNLEGAPKKVGSFFSCQGISTLVTLKGIPEKAKYMGNFLCANTSITDLDGLPAWINSVNCINTKIEHPFDLRQVLLIDCPGGITSDFSDADRLINEFLRKGKPERKQEIFKIMAKLRGM